MIKSLIFTSALFIAFAFGAPPLVSSQKLSDSLQNSEKTEAEEAKKEKEPETLEEYKAAYDTQKRLAAAYKTASERYAQLWAQEQKSSKGAQTELNDERKLHKNTKEELKSYKNFVKDKNKEIDELRQDLFDAGDKQKTITRIYNAELERDDAKTALEETKTKLTETQTNLDNEKLITQGLVDDLATARNDLQTARRNLATAQARTASIEKSLSDTINTMTEENKKLNQDLADLSKTTQTVDREKYQRSTKSKTTLIVSLSVVAGLIVIPIISYFAWKRFK